MTHVIERDGNGLARVTWCDAEQVEMGWDAEAFLTCPRCGAHQPLPEMP